MPAQWTCDVVGQMHKYKISKTSLASNMGVSREYVSMVLNGHRTPSGAETRFREAVAQIVEERSKDSTTEVR